MHRLLDRAAAVALAGWVVLGGATAQASGFASDTFGARAGATATAFVATADDASALFHNPGAAARLQGLQVYGGIGPLLTKTDMDGVDPFPGQRARSRSRDRLLLPPHLFVTRPLRDGVVAGVSLTQPFRHATDWYDPDRFAGRFLATRLDLAVTTLTPTLAVEVTPRVSVGAGLMLSRTELRWDRRLPFFVPDAVSGVVDLAEVSAEATDDLAIGYTVGVLLDRDRYRVGAVLRSGLDVTAEGDVRYTLLGLPAPPPLDLSGEVPADHVATSDLALPLTARVGVAGRLGEKTWLSVDAALTRWSSFEGFRLRSATNPNDANLNPGQTLELDDTVEVAAGVAYAAGPKLRLRAGYRYVPSPMSDADPGPLWVDTSRHVAALGLGYAYESWTFDLSQSLAFHAAEAVRNNALGFDANYDQSGWAFAFSLGYTRL